MGKRRRELADGENASELEKVKVSNVVDADAGATSERKKKKKKKKHSVSEQVDEASEAKISVEKSNGSSLGDPSTDKKRDKKDKSTEKKKKKRKDKHLDEHLASENGETKSSKDSTEIKRKKKRSKTKEASESEAEHTRDVTDDEQLSRAQSAEKKLSKMEKKAKKEKKRKAKTESVPDINNANGNNDQLTDKGISKAEEPHDRFKLPTVEEIFERASEKQDAFLHGYTSYVLPSGEDVLNLDEKMRHNILEKSTVMCERVMSLIHDTIVSINKWSGTNQIDDATAIEETLASDLIRLKKLPVAKQYVEMTLWKRSIKVIRDQLLAASRLGFGKAIPMNGPVQQNGLSLHRDDDPDAQFVSYREAYMKSVVERFSESLDQMREAENMDANRVQFLLRCLDSGASLFANMKCIDNAREGEVRQQ